MENRKYGIEIFKIFCCIGVLAYHVLGVLLPNKDAQFWYFTAAFCVNGFFMISGYLLAEKDDINVEYIESKVKAIMSKLFFWILFWVVVQYIVKGEFLSIWENLGLSAVSSGILPTGWYLFAYCLIMIIAYPIFKFYKKHPILFIIFTIFYLIALNYDFGKSVYTSKIQVLWIHIYVAYFALGMVLNYLSKKIDVKILKNCIHIIASILLVAISYYFYINKTLEPEIMLPPDYYYTKWEYMILIISLFWLMIQINIKNKLVQKIVLGLSKNTFTVYLGQHPLNIYILEYFTIDTLGAAFIWLAFDFGFWQLISILFKKMPILRRLV